MSIDQVRIETRTLAQHPVAIVGAGACGLVCALRLKALGVDAVVIERDATPSGSTALSSGFIPAAQTRVQGALGIPDHFELFAQDIQKKASGQAPSHLIQAYVHAVAEAIDWLEATHGFDFEVLDGFLYPGHRLRRMHSLPQRTGAALMARLLNTAASQQIMVLTQSRVTSLLFTDDAAPSRTPHAIRRVTGLTYQTPQGEIETLLTRAVMLACNGYGGNAQMVRRYIPEMADAVFAGHTGNDGSALRWAESLGAATADLSAYQGHGSWAVPQGALISWALMMDGGIQVNAEGARFHDETRGYSEAAVAVLAQPGGVAWNVIDERGLQLARTFPDFVEAEKAGAVKPLVGHPELDAWAVGQTIEEFLRTSQGGSGDGAATSASVLGARVCDRALKAPFFAIKVTGALFHTQGGLQIDKECRVLRGLADHASELPCIAGLWAGGGAARGVSGSTVEGYLSGNGLLSAFAGGWIAAQSIADRS
jgi:fumarate reductase flavoprotein subunit